MKQLNRKTQIAELFANAVIFLSVSIIAAAGILFGAGSGQVGDRVVGLGYFKPFTMDSNILAAISALILIIYGVRNLIRGTDTTPQWAVILQLMGAACLSLTIVIAALFLGPGEALSGKSYFIMFSNDMFFFHLVNPVLAILSFICLSRRCRLRRRDCIFGVIPTILYSIVYLLMVVVFKRWNDFYNFTFGGRYELIPAVIVVIYALVLGLSLMLIRGHNRGIGRG